MMNELTILYLFLGGAGAGSSVVLCGLEVMDLRSRYAQSAERDAFLDADALHDLLRIAWPICSIVLIFATLCLMFDLGRFDRIWIIFAAPSTSLLSIGAYALAVAVLITGFFALRHLFNFGGVAIAAILAAVQVVDGAIVALYTGVLLQSMPSVAFWSNPLLAIVFLFSSLSSGIALVLLGSPFTNTRSSALKHRIVRMLCRADVVIITLEAIAICMYLVMARSSSVSTASADALLMGGLAWIFWGGVVFCGMVGPAVLDIMLARGSADTLVLWLVLMVLCGALALRVCFVQAAQFDITRDETQMFGLAIASDTLSQSDSIAALLHIGSDGRKEPT